MIDDRLWHLRYLSHYYHNLTGVPQVDSKCPGAMCQVPGYSVTQSHEYCGDGPPAWSEFYLNEPTANATGATEEELNRLLLGGEVSAWGNWCDHAASRLCGPAAFRG